MTIYEALVVTLMLATQYLFGLLDAICHLHA